MSFIVVVVVVGTIPYQKDMVTHERFTHFVGYGCGYYSYLYAKVVSAHLWSKIFQKNQLIHQCLVHPPLIYRVISNLDL